MSFISCFSFQRIIFQTISETSKTLMGNACFLFSLTVFKIPGKSEERTTWYSKVFGFPNFTAVELSSFLFKNTKFSSCEHYIKKDKKNIYKIQFLKYFK